MTTLSDKACPRCGCYNIKNFKCSCGEVHDDYCDGCGRWVSLPDNQHIELSEVDAPCTYGPVAHKHSSAEKVSRIKAFYAARRKNK